MSLRSVFALVLSLPVLWLLAPPASADSDKGFMADEIPPHDASSPTAEAVTEANLVENERFWPYRVSLTGAWQTPAGETLRGDSEGVLIRVEPAGVVRVDFGRDGLYEVPVARTDVVERANRVRTGELEKEAPNFVWAFGARLIDSSTAIPQAYAFALTAQRQGFLCVFADPGAEDFAALAKGLAGFQDRSGLQTIFFAQGRHRDDAVRKRLRALDWKVPFVVSHLSAAYTPSLLSDGTQPPAVLLVTPEGRRVFESVWQDDVAGRLTAAVDESLGAPPSSTAAVEADASR